MFDGKRLKELRKRFGYSREKMGELLGISDSNIPRYESGKMTPSADIVARMAEVFNISADYLLRLTDDLEFRNDMELTEKELKVITAMRHGDRIDAIKLITEDE